METNEEPTVDIDSMSDEELDSFLEEATGLDADAMENLDVVDEGTTTEEVTTEEEETTSQVEEEPNEEGAEDELQDEEEDSTEEEVTEEEPVSQVDLEKYEAQELATMTEVYEDLFKNGIKASGIERTVRDPEHLKTLVRIGFSANENNRRIKPYLKQLKSLEQAGVSLEDDNLNFLVDVMNGNKDAIKELVKNKLNMEEDELQSWYDEDADQKDYVPNDHVMTDSRFQLEEILDEIKTTDTYSKTVDFITSVDDDGKVLISENPSLVKLLNDDMQSGSFQKAIDEAYFRMDRGLLPKQSILQSYIQVMQDPDFYNSLNGAPSAAEVTKKVMPSNTPNKKEVVNRKKRASNVGTSKGAAPSSKKNVMTKDVNKMSETEFEDFYNSLDIDD
jgi:hypothetical protein